MAALFGGWGADPFAEQVEKATSELLPAGQEDIALNLEICDQVRAKQVPAKQAIQVIKKRLGHKNPNVVLLSLGLTDICIKNGGDHFLVEVASREFMDNLASILRNPAGVNNDVKNKALGLIQNWSQIADSRPHQMGYITETYKSLRSSGFEFPPMDAKSAVSAALVETKTAPEWIDSDVCMRCRTAFSTFNRKHHCRNCGNVFCNDCSSKTMALPWFGIGQDVRVCDGCYAKKAPPNKAKLSRSTSTVVTATGRGGLGSHQRSRTMDSGSKRSGASTRKEEDDLELAIKLSLEASSSSGSRPGFVASQPPVKEGRPTRQADGRMLEGTDADDDPDLAAAIAASLRDYAAPTPSAPDGLDDGRATPRAGHSHMESRLPLPPSLDLPASDVDALLSFSQSAAAQEAYARHHGQWQPPYQQHQTQELYERATAARPRMARNLDEATRRRGVLVSMHDKLSEAVRLYDRLLDAQMSRPTTYAGNHYYSAPSSSPPVAVSYSNQVGHAEGSGMYPSLPPTGAGAYGKAEQLSSHQQYQQQQHPPPLMRAYSTSSAESTYSQYQNKPQYSTRPQYGRDEGATQSSYTQYTSDSHAAGSAGPSAPSAPPPSSSAASAYSTGSPRLYNQWQSLELPSAPTSALPQGPGHWTTLSPPSQLPAQGALYGNIPTMPQFEALPAHEQQQHQQRPQQQQQQQQTLQMAPSAPVVSSPTSHQADLSNYARQSINGSMDTSNTWHDVPIKRTGATLADDNASTGSSRAISSPYSAQPWNRPVETPLIDL